MRIKRFFSLALLICTMTVTAKTTVIHNINGYTMVEQSTEQGKTGEYQWQRFSSIAFRRGRILEVASGDLADKYSSATFIDGKGKVMLPGLIDAHGHIQNLGFSRLEVDVRGLGSAVETAQAVQQYAKQHPKLDWIKGRGWNQELWPSRKFPSAKDMDEYVSDKPVWLTRVDGHAGWANRQALAYAGISKETLDPDGGKIVRDENGNPTGVLVDKAMSLIQQKIPKPSKDAAQVALENASEHLLSLGLSSIHDAGISFDTYRLYKNNAAKQDLKIRIYAMLSAHDPKFLDMLKLGRVTDGKDMLSVRSVKLSVDGALGSRGAAMIKPYSDRHEQHGLMLWSTEQLEDIFAQVLGSDFQLNVHAIGDRGNQVVLDHFSQGFRKSDTRALRHRIEHAQVVSLDDIKRFKSLNIIPSMQPTHATSDMNMAQDRVGKQRLAGAYAWRKFLQQGSRIAAGSDFPVELANPFYGIHAAVTRQNRENQPTKGWIPEEAMTVREALRAFTIDAAYAAHQEQVIGSLEPGKWADFILIDKDVFTINPQQLWQTKVLETWIGGEKRYSLAN